MTYISTPVVSGNTPNVVHIVRSGCIRLGQRNKWGGPYWHINPAHTTVGFQVNEARPLVELTGNNLGIIVRSVDSGMREEVLAVHASVDESLAREQMAVGGSGGIGKTTLTIYKTVLSNGVLKTIQINPRSLSNFPNDYYNIWLTITSLGYPA